MVVIDGLLSGNVFQGAGVYIVMQKISRFYFLIYFALLTGICLMVQYMTGTYGSDRALTNDEASHYVNSLLILDFLRDGHVFDAMGFGIQYYEHFPRVSIGHWPPFFYVIQSMILVLFGRGIYNLLIFQAVVAGLAATIVSVFICKRQGFWVGLAAGVMVLCSPALMFQINAIMIDIFLSLLLLLTALSWGRFIQTDSWRWAMAFAGLASCAILSKGNAFGLAFLPLLFCVIQRDFRVFASAKLWGAAFAVACLTIPWYILTYKISSDGFEYSWGLEFTRKALSMYSVGLASAFGWAGVVALLAGVITLVRTAKSAENVMLTSILSMIVASFIFLILVPVVIDNRYLITLVPAGVIVVAYGVGEIIAWAGKCLSKPVKLGYVVTLTVVCIALNAYSIVRIPHVHTLHMNILMRTILESKNTNPLVLVAGCPRAEGALIAAFAEADVPREHYILRGFKALASDNFMGSNYNQRFSSTKNLSTWLTENRIGWVVVDTSDESLSVFHTRQLLELFGEAPLGWKLCAVLPHDNGETRLYMSDQPGPSPELLKVVLQQVAPEKVIGKTAK